MTWLRPFFSVLVLCGWLFAATHQCVIAGTVVDPLGAAIKNARVVVHWDSSGSGVGLKDNVGIRNDLIVTTDDKGRYLVAVPPGFYDVFVSAEAFTPIAAKIRVRTAKTNTFNTTLKADPLVMRELGHEIRK